ncbi:MAG: insulinase family protein [Cytophagaceae bacterium]|nr:insulinase family protein [Cytophagaceae bacterium]
MLDRSIAPPFREIDSIDIVKAESHKLDNGIPFHIIKAGKEQVIRLEIIFEAGHWFEHHNGVSYFTTKLLSAGTSRLSSKEIEEKIAFYGSFIDLVTGYDRSTLTIYTLARHLENLLPLVRDIITDPVFPDEELKNLKNISSQNLKVNLEKTSFLASKNFRELLFGKDHPYGRIIDEEAISRVNRETLLSFHKKNFTSYNCDIILSGNGNQNFYELINNYLGKSEWGKYSKEEVKFDIKPSAVKTHVINKRGSVQSSIRMGLLLFPIDHPDYFKVNLLIEIFGGYFGSRLMKNIREEKGYTYGINASFHSLRNAGYLAIGTDVNKENTANTIHEILKEVKILKTVLTSEEELRTVKNYLIGNFINSLSTPFGLADKFKSIYYHNLDYSFYDKYISSLKTIFPADLRETANLYFKEEDFLEVVVGGK